MFLRLKDGIIKVPMTSERTEPREGQAVPWGTAVAREERGEMTW